MPVMQDEDACFAPEVGQTQALILTADDPIWYTHDTWLVQMAPTPSGEQPRLVRYSTPRRRKKAGMSY